MFLAVVCDGAGSASRGREGAEAAARTVIHAAQHTLRRLEKISRISDQDVWDWIDAARDQIGREAMLANAQLGDYATTLVAVTADSTDVLIAHIGDGAVVAKFDAQQSGHKASDTPNARSDSVEDWHLLSGPHKGEYVNQTTFITDEPMVSLRITRQLLPVVAIAMFSDGIEHLVLHSSSGVPHGPFFERMTKALATGNETLDRSLSRRLRRYLNSDAITSRTDDDVTLIIATRFSLNNRSESNMPNERIQSTLVDKTVT